MSATEGKVAAVSAQGLETCPGPLRRYQSTVRGDTDRGSSAIFTRGVQTATGWTIRLRSPILYAFTHALNNMHRKPVFNLGFGPFVFGPTLALGDQLIA